MGYKKGIRRSLCALLLAAAAVVSVTSPALAASVSDFYDVSSGSWYYDSVAFAVDNGLFNGTSDSTFSPKGKMTRGMFITVLGRYAGVSPDAWKSASTTADVNLRSGPGEDYSVIGSVYAGASVTLTGHSGNWYKVDSEFGSGYISADYVVPSYHHFTDVDYGSYYAGYAIWGYEAGIVNGMGSTDLFAPERNVTREQICKLLYGYANYAGIYLSRGSTVTFADQGSISGWAVDGVDAMQATGIVQGENRDGGVYFRPGSYATRAEAATIFRRLWLSSETPQDPESGNQQQESGGQTEYSDQGNTTYTDNRLISTNDPNVTYSELTSDEAAQVDAAIAAFMQSYYYDGMTDYDKALAAHDFIADNVDYAEDVNQYKVHTTWAALVNHYATCWGYAHAFKALCDAMGLNCYYVVQNDAVDTTVTHTWNVVQVDGQWYIVDVQYDDSSHPYYSESVWRRYFLASDDAYFSHFPMGYDSSIVPACPYNHPWNGYYN